MKVAITGHQYLGSDETAFWVSAELEILINSLKITTGYTCLAIGTDQLFAEVLLKHAVPFVAVLACAEIEKSFKDAEAVAVFRQLCAQASGIIRLPFEQPGGEAYFAAGKVVVDQADLLLAVWDGQPAKGLGGTADVVGYAQQVHKRVIHLDPLTRKIAYLNPA